MGWRRGSTESPTCTTKKTGILHAATGGVSEWTLTGTTTDGVRLEVRGCDLWEFKDGLIIRKDSYWKLVESV